MTKTLAVLGSTGSIGVQALEVARLQGFEIVALTSNVRTDILEGLGLSVPRTWRGRSENSHPAWRPLRMKRLPRSLK